MHKCLGGVVPPPMPSSSEHIRAVKTQHWMKALQEAVRVCSMGAWRC